MDIFQLILSIILPTCFGLIAYTFKSIITRLDRLEIRIEHTMVEERVRVLIDDKLSPLYIQHREIKEDLMDLKNKMNQVLEMLLRK